MLATTNAEIEGAPLEGELTAEDLAEIADTAAARIDGTRMRVPWGGIDGAEEILHFDDAAGTFTIERVTDVEPVLEWCKGRFNEGIANRHSEFRQIASVPPEVLDIWGKAKGYGLPDGWYLKKEYHHLVMAAVHDSDLASFRTLAGNFIRRGG